jgi:MoxR-like ATPase
MSDKLPGDAARILDAVSGVVVGKDDIKRLLLVAFLCGGHVLIEGVPGTAKTLLGKTFAKAIGGEFKRVQLTPDLLPADVTGFYLYTTEGTAKFIRGPIFANVVLADELNRTTPRTQAAFLEAMQENQVTIEGERHELPAPFMVIASQQPAGAEGTYPLTHVQVDRFMFRSWSGYPDRQDEAEILARADSVEDPIVPTVTTLDQALALRDAVRRVYVAAELRAYIVDLIHAVRETPDVATAPGPRASITLYRGARALAFLDGREYVLPDDIKPLVGATLFHRMHLKEEAEMDGVTPDSIVARVLEQVEVPKPVR